MSIRSQVMAGQQRCCEHGLPTAAVVRSSRATPARRRGQACNAVIQAKASAFGAALSTPPTAVAGVDNTTHFRLIVAG
jgi:hypothetical protein